MSFRDFSAHFTRLEIVNLNPDSLEDEEENTHKWVSSNYEGSWIKGASAGGCRNHLGIFTIQLSKFEKKKKKFVNIFQFWANKIIALLIDWSISDVSETFHMNPQYRITLEDPDGNWRELMAAFLGFDY